MLLTHLPLARSLSFCHAPFASQTPEGANPRPSPATWAFCHPAVLRPISFSINTLYHKSPPRKGRERPSFSLPRIFYTKAAAFPTLRPGCSSMSAASSPRRPTRRRGSSERRELSLRAGKAEAWLQHSIPEHGLRARDTTTSLTVVQGMISVRLFPQEKFYPHFGLSSHIPNCRFQILDFGLEEETAEDAENAEEKTTKSTKRLRVSDFRLRIGEEKRTDGAPRGEASQ